MMMLQKIRYWLLLGVMLNLFICCKDDSYIPISDIHYSGLAYELNVNQSFVKASCEIQKFIKDDGRLLGIVFALPEHFSGNTPINIKGVFSKFLYAYKCIDNQVVGSRNSQYNQLFISIEGVYPEIKNDILTIEEIKIVAPLHNMNNIYGYSCYTDSSIDLGLTNEGLRLVNSIFKNKKIVDVSHCSEKTFWDIIKISKNFLTPVIASHSGVKFINNHPRNLSDEQIIEIARTGGGVGVIFHMPFIMGSKLDSDLDIIVKQIIYIKNLVGISHVFIGSDLCDGILKPNEIEELLDEKKIADRLSGIGFTNLEIKKVMYSNINRILGITKSKKNDCK